jgi:hypothetical protein
MFTISDKQQEKLRLGKAMFCQYDFKKVPENVSSIYNIQVKRQ